MSKKRKAAGYLRRSTKDQDASIKEQQAAIEAYAARNGYDLRRWYTDDGISGDSTEQREEFQNMRSDASNGHFEAVICWDQDRFGRFDSIEAGYWIKPFRDAGVVLVTLNDGMIDWNDFTGRMMFGIKQEAKHQFLRDLSRNVLRGQVEAAKQGSWIGQPPYAYTLEGPRKSRQLVIDDQDKADVVKRIFHEYVTDDRSLHDIARRLTADGILSAKGGQWRYDAVGKILKNVAYIGTYKFNSESRGKYYSYQNGEIVPGKRDSLNDDADLIVIQNHHEAIVDKGLFNRAQRKLSKGKTGRSPYTPETNPYLLTGKLVCGRCGSPLWGKKNGNPDYRYYDCSKRKYEGNDACEGTTVREDVVLAFISKTIQDEFLTRDERRKIIQKLKRTRKKGNDGEWIVKQSELTEEDLPEQFAKLRKMIAGDAKPGADLSRLQKRLDKLTSNIAKLKRNMMYADDPSMLPEFKSEIETLESQRDELSIQIKNVPTDDDINRSVRYVIRTLLSMESALSVSEIFEPKRDEISKLLKVVDAIKCFTSLSGNGNGRRHTLQKIELHFFNADKVVGLTMKSNLRLRLIRATSSTVERPGYVSDSYGNRTHPSAVKGRYPLPIDERAVSCAQPVRRVGQEAIESPWPGLQPGALPFKLPTQ